MDEPHRLIFELFGASGGIWMVLYLISYFSAKKFIVKRYREETHLSETRFFTKHAPFIKYLPDHLSAGFYVTHLVSFAWAWKFINFIKEKRPQVTYFDDIPNPNFVTQHFTKSEIAKAKRVIASGMTLFLYLLSYLVLVQIWPEAFGR